MTSLYFYIDLINNKNNQKLSDLKWNENNIDFLVNILDIKINQYLSQFGNVTHIQFIDRTMFLVNMTINDNDNDLKCLPLFNTSPIFITYRDSNYNWFANNNIQETLKKIEWTCFPILPEIISDDNHYEYSEKTEIYISENIDLFEIDINVKKIMFHQTFNKPIHFFIEHYDCNKDCCHIKLEKENNIINLTILTKFYNYPIFGLELLKNLQKLYFDDTIWYYPKFHTIKKLENLKELHVGYLFMDTITNSELDVYFCGYRMCNSFGKYNFILNLFDNFPSQLSLSKACIQNVLDNISFIIKVPIKLEKEPNLDLYKEKRKRYSFENTIQLFIYYIENSSHESVRKLDYILLMLLYLKEFMPQKDFKKLIDKYTEKNIKKITNANYATNILPNDIIDILTFFFKVKNH